MQSLSAGQVRVRAHAKTHKSPEIAKRQIAAGAVGVCCQKVSEAEAMVEGGVQRRPGQQRDRRRAEARAPRRALAARAHRRVRRQRRQPARSSRPSGARLDVYIELEVGMRPLRRRARASPRSRSRARSQALRTCASAACRPITAARSTCARMAERRAAIAGAAQAVFDTKELLEKRASTARSSPAPAAAPSCSRSSRAHGTRSSPARTSSWTPTTRATNGRRRCRASSTRSSSSPR